jgi:hypothetical protein
VGASHRLKGLIAAMFARRVLAGVVVSAITLVLIGGVVLTLTSAGCGPAKALHLKSIENHCAVLTAAARPSSPIPTPSPHATPTTQPTPPVQPTDSNPFPVPATGPYPPYNPGASNGNPYQPPDSGSYPPFYPPGSGSGAPATYALTCSLPVFAGGPGSGGFITFPGGNFVADPKSGVTVPSPSPGSPSPPPQMGGPGYFGLSYDRVHSRWLPVPRTQVTPDGSRYAYTAPDSIYVQDAADAGQVELGKGHAWAIVSVEATGVYATYPNVAGLWFLPFSGPATQIATNVYWQAEAAGFAYGTATSQVPQGAANTIVRLDLKSGTQIDFFTRPGASSYVDGFDTRGNPIIQVNAPNGVELWLATGPNTSTVMVVSYQEGWSPGGMPIADSHGIWFSGYVNGLGQNIALFVPGVGLFAMSNLGANPAGGCA